MVKRYPLVEEMKMPLEAPRCFELIKERPHSFFLDSGMDPAKLGRYSFIGADPFLVLKSRGQEISLSYGDGRKETVMGNPFDVLDGLLRRYRMETGPVPVPFSGGAVGYFSYDLCHFIERLPRTAVDDLKLPECYLAFYDTIIAFDLQQGRAYIVSCGFPEEDETARKRRAQARLDELKALILSGRPKGAGSAGTAPVGSEIALKANFSRRQYLKAVAVAREYILAGDIFQVNISQRFEAKLAAPPYELYRQLRLVNSAPFASYLGFEEVSVVSASPERFLRLSGDLVQTRPIKGTRRRGATLAEDAALANELLSSVKDRAENVMIVDLERNDLGRICRYGSVKVTELAVLENYPTVFHLTSTVEGRLSPGKGAIELLKATFPGGSITGAPKVRAMEIIDELEPTRRSVYTGSIGYLGFNGDMDLNIVIRTVLVKDGKACFQVGGGIVYDSKPEAEYEETLDKARALIQALNLAGRVSVEAAP
ncbi:MAG: aminodeoxychorismate synthase component I [Dehalococcoidales bacterium]